jgi:hypothetical protein
MFMMSSESVYYVSNGGLNNIMTFIVLLSKYDLCLPNASNVQLEFLLV